MSLKVILFQYILKWSIYDPLGHPEQFLSSTERPHLYSIHILKCIYFHQSACASNCDLETTNNTGTKHGSPWTHVTWTTLLDARGFKYKDCSLSFCSQVWDAGSFRTSGVFSHLLASLLSNSSSHQLHMSTLNKILSKLNSSSILFWSCQVGEMISQTLSKALKS